MGSFQGNQHGYEPPNAAPPKTTEPKIKTVGSVFDFMQDLQIFVGNARVLPVFIFARSSPFVNFATLMGVRTLCEGQCIEDFRPQQREQLTLMNLESLRICLPAAFSTTEVMVFYAEGRFEGSRLIKLLGEFKDQL